MALIRRDVGFSGSGSALDVMLIKPTCLLKQYNKIKKVKSVFSVTSSSPRVQGEMLCVELSWG